VINHSNICPYNPLTNASLETSFSQTKTSV
jgi:hypothetical protein